MNIAFTEQSLPVTGSVAVAVFAGGELSAAAEELNTLTQGALARAISVDAFDGKTRQFLDILAPANTDLHRIVLFGLGKKEDVDLLTVEAAGGLLTRRANTAGLTDISVMLDDAEQAAHFAFGAELGNYRYDHLFTKEDLKAPSTLESLVIRSSDKSAAETGFAPLKAVAEGVAITRDLVWEPANTLYPASFAQRCQAMEIFGLSVEVLGEAKMTALGMGSLLGVGQGSDKESQLVVMKYTGTDVSEAPVAFVGKGVTFDTGGLSLKPPQSMEAMKEDMGGAATVTGLMATLAKRKAKVNAIGVLGLVENMPSSNAQRPSDVVTSMSGQTIEVLNTDAEGRLVLCDALTFTQRQFKPKAVIDLATLTGAIVVALGEETAGIFSNNDELSAQLTEAGAAEGEEVWRLPVGDYYQKLLKSSIADLRNIGNKPKVGGSSVAAQFLFNFIENDTPWIHIDIAGTAWTSEAFPTKPKGATGFGVRLLDRLVKDNFEK